jgi:hypothetical protein
MNKTDSAIEEKESPEKMLSSPREDKAEHEHKQAPLIRYFSITDEATESYVLGYN